MLLIKTYIAIANHFKMNFDKLDIDIYPIISSNGDDEKVVKLSDDSGCSIKIYCTYDRKNTKYHYEIQYDDTKPRKDLLQFLIDDKLI